MIEKSKIEKLVNEFVSDKGVFLVAVKVSSTNRISVFADTLKGITIDECAAIHRHLEKNLDRNAGDYELQVSSPGLDMPFSVIEQYYKNEGQKVEVVTADGEKFSGVLRNVTSGGFELEIEVRAKGKLKEINQLSFNLEQVKSVKTILTIK